MAYGRVSLAVVAIGAAAFAGHLAAGVDRGGRGSEPVSAGPLRFEAPVGWRLEAKATPLGGLPLDGAAAARAPNGHGLALAGILRGVVFPQELGGVLDPAATQPDAVQLGPLEAYRWRGLEVEGDRLTLLAAPTAMGTAVIACSGRGDALRRCERSAATLRTRGTEATPLDALAFYATGLDATLDRLERRRRAALARPRTPATATAERLETAYERAARSLEDLAPPAAAAVANEELVEDLKRAGAAYGAAARAARRNRREAYAAAVRLVERRERELGAAIAGMLPPR